MYGAWPFVCILQLRCASSSRQRHHTSKAGVIVRERWRCFGRWKWIGDVMMELDQVLECFGML